MLNHIADLSDTYEFFIGYTGQSTSRPWGSWPEAESLFDDLDLDPAGADITTVTIPVYEPASPSRAIGTIEHIMVDKTEGSWTGSVLRLGTVTTPVLGYARVQRGLGTVYTANFGSQTANFATGEVLTFSGGATARLLAQVDSGATGTITFTMLTGSMPAALETITAPSGGDGTLTTTPAASLTLRALVVEWIVSPGTGAYATAGYLFHDNWQWSARPQVRVLTPYQPVHPTGRTDDFYVDYPTPGAAYSADGRGLSLPAPWTVPAGVTDFSQLGLLLPYTIEEGINGYGISEGSDSSASPTTHAASSPSATGFTFANPITAGVLAGGYVIIDWETAGNVMKRSWGVISTNATTSITLDAAGWLGDGDPTGGTIKRYTAWIPYWTDSPHSFLPGEGFSYPNNDMMPHYKANAAGANVRNRPRGQNVNAYDERFGDLIVMAMRLSAAIGKRINVVYLGINAASLVPSGSANAFGFPGKVGWWDYREHLSFAPALSDAGYARVEALIDMVGTAMQAESNTRTPAFLAWIHNQGESDALNKMARHHFAETRRAFIQKIRRKLEAKGYLPYANGAQLPFLQSRIAYITYCLLGTWDYYGIPTVFDGDVNNHVNNAIVEQSVADDFGDFIEVDDLPRLLADPGHFNGVGEAARGQRMAAKMTRLINYALGFGSPALSTPDPIVALCNEALRMIGAQPITSLSQGNALADHCANLYPSARDELLQLRQWGFALRRERLEMVKREATLFDQFGYCYVVPGRALNAFKVLPPNELDTYDETYRPETPTDSPIIGLTYDATFIADYDDADTSEDSLPLVDSVAIVGQDFRIEASPNGHRLIYTDQVQATLQFVERVTDPGRFPPLFRAGLVLYLASKLASAIVKGSKGEQVAATMLKRANETLKPALLSDGNQMQQRTQHDSYVPDHMRARG